MLFRTWSQAHAYDPSDYIETRLELYLVNELNRLLVGPLRNDPWRMCVVK